MEKIYLDKTVLEAAEERLSFIFSEFESVYVCFSGGKDSGLLLNLVLRHIGRSGIRAKVGLMHQDFEAEYQETARYVERTFARMPDYVERHWLCLPMQIRNAMSQASPWWHPWAPECRDIWVRELPDAPYVETEAPWFTRRLQDHETQRAFGLWWRDSHPGKSVALLGLRADESLSRYSAIVNHQRDYKGVKWITKTAKNLYTASPLYDWAVEDVWTANARFGFDYNRLYDLMHMAGCPLHAMRVASPFHDWAAASLKMYRVLDPEAWGKMTRRVGGANFGSIYGGTEAMGHKAVMLPKGHTWKSYAIFLLHTLPEDLKERYEKILDSTNEPDRSPFWKRMCGCILRNDHTMRFMGAGTAKDQAKTEAARAIKAKYANL